MAHRHLNPYSSFGTSGMSSVEPVFPVGRSGGPGFDLFGGSTGNRGSPRGGYGGGCIPPRPFHGYPAPPYRPTGVGSYHNNRGNDPSDSSQVGRPQYNGYQNLRPQQRYPNLRPQQNGYPNLRPQHNGYSNQRPQHEHTRFGNARYPQHNRFGNPQHQHQNPRLPGNPRFQYSGNVRPHYHQSAHGNERHPHDVTNGHRGSRGRGGTGGYGRGHKSNIPTIPSERSEFYCDTCDKSCVDQVSFEEHKSEHMTCKLDGCTFTAQPKVILKHIQMQHSTNLFFRVKGYDSPETVAKWRQERKENFPTPENIAKKSSTNKESRSRGERITGTKKKSSLPVFRYPIDYALEKLRKQSILNNRQTSGVSEFSISRNHKANKSEVVLLENYYSVLQINEKGKLVGKKLALWKPGGALEEADEDSESEDEGKYSDGESVDPFDITDDEVDSEVATAEQSEISKSGTDLMCDQPSCSSAQNQVDDIAPCVNSEEITTNSKSSVLSGLVSYSSDSDLEDGEVKEDEISDSEAEQPTEVPFRQDISDVDNSGSDSDEAELPTEIPIGKQSTFPSPSSSASSEDRNNCPNPSPEKLSNLPPPAKKPKSVLQKRIFKKKQIAASPARNIRAVATRPPTLLRRLLNDEICKERNYILQACRYIVQNNFFDKPKPKEEAQMEIPSTSASNDS